MIEHQASDLFITVGTPPALKVRGKVISLALPLCGVEDASQMILSLMTAPQQKEFQQTHECNFTFAVDNIGRFRVSAFMQRGQSGCVIRYIPNAIPDLNALHLPDILKNLSMMKKGLILIVGSSGVGKTTTLASMLEYRNRMSEGHILTLEDPIEYLHEHKRCIITQREIGADTASFEIALKNAMRQAPDLIQIGEIRDANTMHYAISYAETGHLCLATLHANNATQALERLAYFYPENMRDQLWMDLSMQLRAVVAQTLVPHINQQERIAATEVLINTPIIAEKIRKGEIRVIKEYMNRKNAHGMHTFDQSLFQLCIDKKITYQEALSYADSINDFRLMMKLQNQTPEMQQNERNADKGWTLSEY